MRGAACQKTSTESKPKTAQATEKNNNLYSAKSSARNNSFTFRHLLGDGGGGHSQQMRVVSHTVQCARPFFLFPPEASLFALATRARARSATAHRHNRHGSAHGYMETNCFCTSVISLVVGSVCEPHGQRGRAGGQRRKNARINGKLLALSVVCP